MHDILALKEMCLESRDIFKFWEINDNISIIVQDKDRRNGTLTGNHISC